MKRRIHPGYEIFEELTRLLVEENAGCGKGYTEGVDRLLKYDQPADVRIRKLFAKGVNGAPDVPLHLFEKEGMPENTPLLIAIHGGGYTGGRWNFDCNRVTYYLEHVPCKVLCVDYRLAPDGRFPKALEDCYSAVCYAVQNSRLLGIDPARIALTGYSAGGTLAAGLSLYLRDKTDIRISALLLTYPVLKSTLDTVSSMQFYSAEDAPMLHGFDFPRMARDYLGDLDGREPSYYAMPGYCRDLFGMPPTAIVVGEIDPLRDECMDFAAQLLKTGVPCEFYCMPRLSHSFDLLTDGELTQWIWQAFARALRREFGMYERKDAQA